MNERKRIAAFEAAAIEANGIKPDRLWTKMRFDGIHFSRWMVWAAVRDQLGWTYSQIARHFGYDSSTVLYGINSLCDGIQSGDRFLKRKFTDFVKLSAKHIQNEQAE